MSSEQRAYIPPHLRKEGQEYRPPRPCASIESDYLQNRNEQHPSNQRNSHEKRVRFNEHRSYEPWIQNQNQNETRKHEIENIKLKEQIAKLEKDLSFYSSNIPKVPEQDLIDLKQQFDSYKKMKYEEFAIIKEKLSNHDQIVHDLNREIKRMEEQVRIAELKVKQYESSIRTLNDRIKYLSAHQVESIKPQQEQETKNEMIADDWINIKKSIDYVLSLDKKISQREGFNIPALKLTRQLIDKY